MSRGDRQDIEVAFDAAMRACQMAVADEHREGALYVYAELEDRDTHFLAIFHSPDVVESPSRM
jgi:hypothetical protein